MNFIKDTGGKAFLENIKEGDVYVNVWKIILLDNQCTESFKKDAKKYEVIVI